jgi:integrase/recombinase XerD
MARTILSKSLIKHIEAISDAYSSDCRTMMDYFHSRRIWPISIDHMVAYARDLSTLEYRPGRFYSAESINKKLSMLIVRLDQISLVLSLHDILSDAIARRIETAKKEISLERAKRNMQDKRDLALREHEIRNIINACKRESTRVIISVLYQTGARISELLSAKYMDITISRTYITLKLRGKGNAYRSVYISSAICDRVFQCFGRRPPGDYIFCENEKRITSGMIYRRITRAAMRAGYPNVSPHTFRHSFATRMINETKDISRVSKYLGHSSVDTTIRYYDSNEFDASVTPTLPTV